MEDEKKIERPVLANGSIVFCKGSDGAGSFYGIVYDNGVPVDDTDIVSSTPSSSK